MQFRCLCTVALVLLFTPPGRADENSDRLFAKCREVLKNAHTLTLDRTTSIQMEGKSAGKEIEHIQLLKPGYWKMTRNREEPRVRICDGKHVYSSWTKKKQYIKVDLIKPEFLYQDLGPAVGVFFGSSVILPNQSGKYLGKQDLEGKSYEVVEVRGETPGGIPARQLLYFGASGLLEVREFHSEIDKGKEMMLRDRLSNIVMGAPLKPADFTFKLPSGYTILDATTKKSP
jgi:outer membrane lipoprotein-sorting protein